MNKKLILNVAVWLAALICCLVLLDRVTRRDDGERKYGNFFAEENNFDVLFMGTSRVLDAIQPMELWRDYGMTSYNMGCSSECLDMTAQVLDLALDFNKPSVVVVDVYYVAHAIDEAWAYSFRHMFYDELPLSRRKIEAVYATQPEGGRIEFLMPFSLYHGRWEELLGGSAERIVDCEPYMMGSELRAGRMGPIWPYARTTAMNEGDLPGKDALRRIAALCRENGIEPVFIMLPAPISEQEQMDVNSVQLIAQELGVPFINMLDHDPLLIDFETDMYDYLGHMNPDGATKLTAYLGQWLTQNYAFSDKRGDAAYDHWDENLALYEAHRERVWSELTLL